MDQFKQVILNYLTEFAKTDTHFNECFQNPDKNIDDCVNYIINTVKESGRTGFTDDEIYQMARHYYLEKDLKVNKAEASARIIINLSDEDKEKAYQNALKRYEEEQLKKLKKKTEKPKQDNNLFDLI